LCVKYVLLDGTDVKQWTDARAKKLSRHEWISQSKLMQIRRARSRETCWEFYFDDEERR